MISKSVIVFWSVTCLTIFWHLAATDTEEATAYYILFTGLIWAVVVAPTALIGKLFKSKKVYSTKMRVVRGGVLAAVAIMTFGFVHETTQQQQRELLKVHAQPMRR